MTISIVVSDNDVAIRHACSRIFIEDCFVPRNDTVVEIRLILVRCFIQTLL
jgi:hypothetical protein